MPKKKGPRKVVLYTYVKPENAKWFYAQAKKNKRKSYSSFMDMCLEILRHDLAGSGILRTADEDEVQPPNPDQLS